MAWGDTYRVKDWTVSGLGEFRCPHCNLRYSGFKIFADFLRGHLATCERDYRNG